MTTRRSHYEMAFEAYLNRRGTPYVAVEDVRHFVKGRLGTKSFDYIVYPSGGSPCLVDVKGRKLGASPTNADARSKNWVTRADLEGMTTWQDVFGSEYVAMFVFGFWLAGEKKSAGGKTLSAPTNVMAFAGRQYSFWVAKLSDYRRLHKQLSVRWDTITIPTKEFRRISERLETAWPPAPC